MFSRPNCSTSPAFNGHLLPARKKIVLMMLFGFEVSNYMSVLCSMLNKWICSRFTLLLVCLFVCHNAENTFIKRFESYTFQLQRVQFKYIKYYFSAADYLRLQPFSLINKFIFRENTPISQICVQVMGHNHLLLQGKISPRPVKVKLNEYSPRPRPKYPCLRCFLVLCLLPASQSLHRI